MNRRRTLTRTDCALALTCSPMGQPSIAPSFRILPSADWDARPGKVVHSLFSEIGTGQREVVMVVNSTVLIALVLIGATVPSFAEEEPKQNFTCTAKTFNECLM